MYYKKPRVILQTAVYPEVERLRVEGEGRTEETWASDFGTARRGEATRVSMRRDVAKEEPGNWVY